MDTNYIEAESKNKFSFISASLKNKELENEFVNFDIGLTSKYIKPVLLLMGTMYLLFAIPDFFINNSKIIFTYILIARVTFSLVMTLFYIKMKFAKDYLFFYNWISVCKILVSVFYLFSIAVYESPNFLIQAFGLLIMLLAFFMVPNKFINKILISIFFSILFFITSVNYCGVIKINEFSAAIVFTLCTILFCSISAYRTDYFKRMEFLGNKKLLVLLQTDTLTGIYNRMKFDKELQAAISKSQSENTNLSMILFDFDDFKLINDNFGHIEGDLVLKDTVKILCKVMRDTDIFARWGGEEFIVLLPNTALMQAVEIAETFRIEIDSYTFNHNYMVTCSFGVAEYVSNEDSISFLKHADDKLYEAKKLGKNQVRY